jgi:hypothetical protein
MGAASENANEIKFQYQMIMWKHYSQDKRF